MIKCLVGQVLTPYSSFIIHHSPSYSFITGFSMVADFKIEIYIYIYIYLSQMDFYKLEIENVILNRYQAPEQHGSRVSWKCKSLRSRLTLCDPVDCSPPGFSVLGILQARILEWFAISFSRRSSRPRDWTWVSCIAGRFFTVWATREYLGINTKRMYKIWT